MGRPVVQGLGYRVSAQEEATVGLFRACGLKPQLCKIYLKPLSEPCPKPLNPKPLNP